MPTKTIDIVNEYKCEDSIYHTDSLWYSEQEVQLKDKEIRELKDKHNIEIKRLQQWSDTWKESAQKSMLKIEKLQKENEELKISKKRFDNLCYKLDDMKKENEELRARLK